MEDKVFIKDSNLHIHYEVFNPFEFRKDIRKDFTPINEINFILEHVGTKGGFHGFEIIGFKKRDYHVTSDRYVTEYEVLREYGRGSRHIFEGIKKVLPDLKIQTITEKGSAYV
jgi:hypothetical protein